MQFTERACVKKAGPWGIAEDLYGLVSSAYYYMHPVHYVTIGHPQSILLAWADVDVQLPSLTGWLLLLMQ